MKKNVKARIVRILPWGSDWQTVVLECGHKRRLRKAEVERAQLFIDKRVPCGECAERTFKIP